MFVASFEKGASETDAIIGGPPNPEQDNEENVISVFVSRVIDPDNPFKTSVRNFYSLVQLVLMFIKKNLIQYNLLINCVCQAFTAPDLGFLP